MEEVTSKEAFNKYRPNNVVFVLSVDLNGKPSGMVASMTTKCSNTPPLMAVAISNEGHTHKLIRESKEFVIAVPNKAMEKEIEFFGSTSGKELDKFKETKIATIPAKHIKTPLLRDATVNFECKLVSETPAGNHILFIGEVLASYVNDKKVLLNFGKVDGKRKFEEF